MNNYCTTDLTITYHPTKLEVLLLTVSCQDDVTPPVTNDVLQLDGQPRKDGVRVNHEHPLRPPQPPDKRQHLGGSEGGRERT